MFLPVKHLALICITILALITFSFFPDFTTAAPNYTLKDLGQEYEIHWVGNSFPGTQIVSRDYRRHVQQRVDDMFVMPDGTCYTNSIWDERFAHASGYKDKNQIVILDKMMGWGRGGGNAVTANNKYVYVAVRVTNKNFSAATNEYSRPIYPSDGNTWYGVRVYQAKTGKIAGFPQGYGVEAGVIAVNTNDGPIQGLAIHQKRLYVSDTANDAIKVYDLENLSQQPVLTWSVKNPGKLAFDSEGYLWVIEHETNQILRLNPKGEKAPQTIELPKNSIASDIAIDRQGRLLVTDIGTDYDIKIYNNITLHPKFEGTFGKKNGIFSEVTGQFLPLKFYKPTGIGSDRDGNIYVAQNAWSARNGGGTIIESYQPDGSLRWHISSLEFMSNLDINLEGEKYIYSKERRYYFDKDREPGKSVVYQSTTLNPFKYPHDPRLSENLASVQFRHLNNKNLLFTIGNLGRKTAVFRFDPSTDYEIAIPYAMLSMTRRKGAIPNQPKDSEWIWIDRNFNGQFEKDEFIVNKEINKKKYKPASDLFIEHNGTLWTVKGKEIRKISVIGFEKDYPLWNFESVQKFTVSAPFVDVRRILYDAATDSMYLTGYTADAPYDGDWKAIGKKIARVDNWSHNPRIEWIKETPWYYGRKDSRQKPIAIDIEGDYVFIGIGSTGKSKNRLEQSIIFVYDKVDGSYIGSMQHNGKVGPIMSDQSKGLNARKTSDGSYLIFLGDSAFARSIVFNWTPKKILNSTSRISHKLNNFGDINKLKYRYRYSNSSNHY